MMLFLSRAHVCGPSLIRFVMAENPVSRTWIQQVFLPLVPGVDSLLEPLQEQAEDAQVWFSVVFVSVRASVRADRSCSPRSDPRAAVAHADDPTGDPILRAGSV